MDYKIVVAIDAEEDLDRYIQYLLYEKQNEQAAKKHAEWLRNYKR